MKSKPVRPLRQIQAGPFSQSDGSNRLISIHFPHGWSEIGVYLSLFMGQIGSMIYVLRSGWSRVAHMALGFNGPVGEVHPKENQNIVAHWPSGAGRQPGLFICQLSGPSPGPSWKTADPWPLIGQVRSRPFIMRAPWRRTRKITNSPSKILYCKTVHNYWVRAHLLHEWLQESGWT